MVFGQITHCIDGKRYVEIHPPSKPAELLTMVQLIQYRCTQTPPPCQEYCRDDTVDGRSGINATADIHCGKEMDEPHRWMEHCCQ